MGVYTDKINVIIIFFIIMTHNNYEFYIASQYNSNINYNSNITIILIIIIIESTESTHWLYYTLRNHMMLYIIIV